MTLGNFTFRYQMPDYPVLASKFSQVFWVLCPCSHPNPFLSSDGSCLALKLWCAACGVPQAAAAVGSPGSC